MSLEEILFRDPTLRFFITPEHSCSYIDGNNASTLFLDPERDVTDALYQALTDKGFRRSGLHLYRPHCSECQACLSARIPVDVFQPDRTQRKTANRNADLTTHIVPAIFNETHFALYQRYINGRHTDGDMFPPDEAQYRSFLTSSFSFSRMIEFRLKEELVAVAVVDLLEDGISAIYTFFAPEREYERRSLGSFAILWQIEQARKMALPYVYLGYWINASPKMNYKGNYRPLEYLENRQWHRLD
ncbi:Aspartate/glutamate leucyltransferase [Halomonadaceae bacterium LMG 33818]|uniref:arginyltransferase n=1 Tax=Cernens ardua TaxID=3402176 RepID=UPI003EDC097C